MQIERLETEFMESEQVLLNVSPMKGVMQFGKRGKLSPRYIGPFEVLKRVGRWIMNWHCLKDSQGCTRYFMCLC